MGKAQKIWLAFIAGLIAIPLLILRKSSREIIRAVKQAIFNPTPALLIGVAVAAVVIGIIVFFVIRSARKKQAAAADAEAAPEEAEGGEPDETPPEKAAFSAIALRRSFSRAIRTLKTNVSGRDYRYQIPWFLIAGESGAGKTTLLDAGNLNLPMGRPLGKGPEVKSPCNWWFFERGIVLDAAGAMVLRETNGPDGGFEADHRSWKRMMRLLQKYRPKRPIDGIILAIPCTDLVIPDLSPDADTSPFFDRIGEKADVIRKKIWHAQKVTGIRFPVYVLITKSDAITGFSDFCQELPPRLGNHIFGWSSGYAIHSPYSPDWIPEAIEEIHRDLYRTKFEVYTDGAPPDRADRLFQFSTGFLAIQTPLQVYMDHLFGESVYHESFVLRGIYFCGDAGMAPPENPAPTPYFVRDVLAKKVFPEHEIARPTRRKLLSRNRKVLAAQVLAVLLLIILGLGLWHNSSRLRTDTSEMIPVIQKIGDDVARLKSDTTDADSLALFGMIRERSARAPFDRTARNLFDGMTHIRGLTYPFLPSSWFSDIHADIRRVLTIAYDEVILKTLYVGLFNRTKEIFESESLTQRTQSPSSDTVVPVEDLPAFVRLKEFVEQLRELEINVDRYNRLSKSETLDPLGGVIQYLYGINLPPAFYENAKVYHDALKDSEYRFLDPTAIRFKARTFTFNKLTERLYHQLFELNPLSARLRTLSLQMTAFAEGERTGTAGKDLIQAILESIDSLRTLIDNPAMAWVFSDNFDLGEAFDDILFTVDQSIFLGPQLRLDAEKSGRESFEALKTQLREIGAPLIGPILQSDGEALQRELSPKLLAFETDIRKLLKKDLISVAAAPRPSGGSVVVPETGRFQWDTDLIQDAAELLEPYQTFRNEELREFPSDIQGRIDKLTRDTLEGKILDILSRAQARTPGTRNLMEGVRERTLGKEIDRFKAAVPHIQKLLDHLDPLGLNQAHESLARAAHWQASTLLAGVDALRRGESFYSVRGGDLSWWDGKGRLSLNAFDVVDREELEHYLGIQKDRVAHLANTYAAPLIDFLTAHGTPDGRSVDGITFIWNRIIDDLAAYDNKTPGNPIAALEKFILFEMDEITLANYSEKIPPSALAERSGDLFLRRRNALRRMIHHRLDELATENVVERYAAIRTAFNGQLAGRFPFAPVGAGSEYREADPEAIRSFFRRFRDDLTVIENVLAADRRADDPRFSGGGVAVSAFISRMVRVRELFAPYIEPPVPASFAEGEAPAAPPEPLDVPTFDLDVKFRVNRDHEQGANRIIEWSLTVGEQTLTDGRDNQTVRWELGMPVRLTLRWAKDGRDYPVFAGEGAEIDLTSKTVTVAEAGSWSILRFLRRFAAEPGDFDELTDPKPQTLKVEARTARDPDRPEVTEPMRAYIRIILRTPDDAKTVLQMPAFPETAPPLGQLSPRQTEDATP